MSEILKKFGIFILGIVATAMLYATGTVSDPLVAAQLTLNPEKAITQAVDVLKQTPKPEIVEAVAQQTDNDPEAIKDAVDNIKPDEPAE